MEISQRGWGGGLDNLEITDGFTVTCVMHCGYKKEVSKAFINHISHLKHKECDLQYMCTARLEVYFLSTPFNSSVHICRRLKISSTLVPREGKWLYSCLVIPGPKLAHIFTKKSWISFSGSELSLSCSLF